MWPMLAALGGWMAAPADRHDAVFGAGRRPCWRCPLRWPVTASSCRSVCRRRLTAFHPPSRRAAASAAWPWCWSRCSLDRLGSSALHADAAGSDNRRRARSSRAEARPAVHCWPALAFALTARIVAFVKVPSDGSTEVARCRNFYGPDRADDPPTYEPALRRRTDTSCTAQFVDEAQAGRTTHTATAAASKSQSTIIRSARPASRSRSASSASAPARSPASDRRATPSASSRSIQPRWSSRGGISRFSRARKRPST